MTTVRIRDRALHFLFTLALAWALLSFGLMFFGEQFNAILTRPLLGAGDGAVPTLLVIALAGVLTALVVRISPRFLSIPRSVTSARLMVTILVTTFLVGATLIIVLVAVTWVLDPPGPNPENPQYVPLAFWMAPWATAALAPIVGILAAWWWTTRRSRT